MTKQRSLKRIALIVSSGTFISKLGGLLRQLVIAGVFGIGAAYDAYNYAYIIPGFFLVLLGGINGPFHNSMVSVLSRTNKRESAYVISSVSTVVSIFLLLITTCIFIFADPLMHLIGPGLNENIHRMAVNQLRIMAPITLISGLIGIGFGALNANQEFFIPSISPLVSSLVLIILVGTIWWRDGALATGEKGAILLAFATLIGALMQWIIQLPALTKKRLLKLRISFNLRHSAVKEILQIIIPATFSSGMLQINVFTDLFFASGLLGAAAGLSYANFLIQAPLGLISNSILIPLLPALSELTNPNDRKSFIKRLRQGIMLTSTSMIALGAIYISLASPIVDLIYQRGAFDSNAVKLVSGLLIAYGLGMPAYLGRDLLVRVFYALGDAKTPFVLSSIGIFLNIIFDWVLIGGPTPWGNQSPFNLGAQGLVLATMFVNSVTCILLLLKLNSKLDGLPLIDWMNDFLKLCLAGFIGGIIALSLKTGILWPNNSMGSLLKVVVPGLASFSIFGLLGGRLMRVAEVQEILNLLQRRLFIFK